MVFTMHHQLAILLRRMFASRTAFSPGGDDPAVLRLDRAALGVGETQGEPKGIGHCKWIVERSQKPVSTWLDPLPNGWEIATDRDGPGRHSLQKAVRRPVLIGDRDTHLGSPEEGKYLAWRALPHDNDLVSQAVAFDRAPQSRIVSRVDEHNTHTGNPARSPARTVHQAGFRCARTNDSPAHSQQRGGRAPPGHQDAMPGSDPPQPRAQGRYRPHQAGRPSGCLAGAPRP